MLAFTYHPYSDPYHSAFRSMQLLQYREANDYSIDKFRIMDFYLVFPHLIGHIRMPKSTRGVYYELRLNKVEEPYQEFPKPRRLFQQIESIQRTAFGYLSASRLIDIKSYKDGRISRGGEELSKKFWSKIQSANENEPEVIKFIVDQVAALPLYGPDGLKARTGLMEFRYDVA